MKKIFGFICICISNVVFADNPLNPFPHIEGHFIWKILGLVGIIISTVGLVVNSDKLGLFGLAIAISSASMCFDNYILAYIGFAVSFLIILNIQDIK